jgi:hypothetical protein
LPRVRLLVVALLASASPALAEEPPGPFELSEWRVPGRAIEAFAVRAEDGAETVLVLSLRERPPEEGRFATWLPRDRSQPANPVEIPASAVVVDAVELGLAPGPELVWLSAGELRIVSASGETLRSERIEPPLPLPPRTWELSHLEFIRDWDSDGRLEALLPTAEGARLHPLVPGDDTQALALSLIADYGSPALDNPFRPGFLTGMLAWPTLALGDDDGDGRSDLFAATRYELLVFRAGEQGLPAKPSARRAFPRFTAEEERRHVSNTLLAFPGDLDGDGRADLVVHRMVGTLTKARATTTFHANSGAGADPLGEPWAQIDSAGGTAAVELVDIDRDGRMELLEGHVAFGVLQAVRMLTLGRVEARLRVLALPQTGGAPVETWAADVSFPFDFATSRILGLLPYVEADWNGDGLLDLCWGDGSGELRFRLGEAREGGAGFGRVAAAVKLPISGDLVSADLNGDGLADFVALDPLDLEGRVRIGINRGTLPGTKPTLRSAP